MNVDYPSLHKRIVALCASESDEIAKMATIACELFHSDMRFDWVGFYRGHSPRSSENRPLTRAATDA